MVTDIEKKYIDDGNACLFCLHENLVKNLDSVEGYDAYFEVQCPDCGESWTEVFVLNKIITDNSVNMRI